VTHGGRGEGGEVLVAGVALRTRRNMVGRFAQCRAAVVASRADAGNRRIGRSMVEGDCGPAGGGTVAGIALGAGANVGARFGLGVLRQVGAVVAGRAVAGGQRPGCSRMAHRRRVEGGAVMAGVALRRGRNMRCGFGQGIGEGVAAVVARGAIAGGQRPAGPGVAHDGRVEGGKVLVAGVALRTGRNMVGRFSQCAGAVVASGADTRNRRIGRSMVEGDRGPAGGGRVTGIALRAGADVGARFGLGVLRQVGAVVAGGAVARCRRAGSAGMAHGSRGKGRFVGVADAALCAAGDVAGGFTQRRGAVVAGRAVGVAGCVDECGRLPRRRAVAGVTLSHCRKMGDWLVECTDGQVSSAVAGGAVPWGHRPGSSRMAHGRRGEHRGGMAEIALTAGRDVRSRLGERVGKSI